MPLVSAAIAAICSSMNGTYQNACSKGLEATIKVTEVYQTDEKLENYVSIYANNKADRVFGPAAVNVLGGGVFLYNTVNSKTLKFNLPNLGICESVSNQIAPGSYRIDLKWNFPIFK